MWQGNRYIVSILIIAGLLGVITAVYTPVTHQPVLESDLMRAAEAKLTELVNVGEFLRLGILEEIHGVEGVSDIQDCIVDQTDRLNRVRRKVIANVTFIGQFNGEILTLNTPFVFQNIYDQWFQEVKGWGTTIFGFSGNEQFDLQVNQKGSGDVIITPLTHPLCQIS